MVLGSSPRPTPLPYLCPPLASLGRQLLWGLRGCLDPEPLRQVGVRSAAPLSRREGGVTAAFSRAQFTHFSVAERPPLPRKQKGLCGPREGRGLHRPGLAADRLNSWLPSWPLCPGCLWAWTFQRPPAPEILPGPHPRWKGPDQPPGHLLSPASGQPGWAPSPAPSLPWSRGSERKFPRRLSCEET